jgi:hypothetical protein
MAIVGHVRSDFGCAFSGASVQLVEGLKVLQYHRLVQGRLSVSSILINLRGEVNICPFMLSCASKTLYLMMNMPFNKSPASE